MNNMEDKFYTSERGKVFYRIARHPSADVIVFLHGLTADNTLFEKQTEYFSRKYTVLVWDAPAHGKSRPYSDFTYAHAADDLNGILSSENISSAYFVGQSMGGYIIQAFIPRYPEKVKAFIGIDTCPFGNKYYSKSDKWWLRQIEWMSSIFPHRLLVESVAKGCTRTTYAYNNMFRALTPYSKKELCHLMGIGYAGFLAENNDLKISCPVLILAGEFDRTGKVLKYCESWHNSTGYPYRIIKNAAHNSNADNPEQVNAEIEQFIESLT